MLEGSKLLDILDLDDQEVLARAIVEMTLERDHVLFRPGEAVSFCYFPRFRAVASYFVMLQDGEAVETVIIGQEGGLGVTTGEHQFPSFAQACVMNRGSFYRISCVDLQSARRASPTINALFTRYSDYMMAQMLQSIACNASHSIEQRAAKWLCAAVDRTGHSGITMTQEQLAALMGSGRSYASRVVQRFKRDGLLTTRRGGLEVLDYEGLHERACSCHSLVHDRYRSVLKVSEPA